MATISDSDLFEVATLVYGKWAEAFDNLKKCKAEDYDPRICPRKEWPKFHAIRVENAEKELKRWAEIRDRLTPQLPALLGSKHG